MFRRELDPTMPVIHTLRIEMLDGSLLLYTISADEKKELEEWMQKLTDSDHESKSPFMSFYIPQDRYVFVCIKDLARLIFCFDHMETVADPKEYHDNFNVLPSAEELKELQEEIGEDAEEQDAELYLPTAIVKLRGVEKALQFEDDDYLSDFNTGVEMGGPYLERGMIRLTDEDGEDNYIPVANITCLEVARRMIYEDDEWAEIQRYAALEKQKN